MALAARRKQQSGKRTIRFGTALSIVLSLVVGGVVAEVVTPFAEPAVAATDGYGYRGGSGVGSGWLGSVIMPDGTQGFCIDAAGLYPSGYTSNAGYVSSIAGTTSATWPNHNDTRTLSGTDIRKLNYALTKYTPLVNTNNEGAALNAFVYSISVAGNLAAWGISDWVDYVNVRVPYSARATVISLTNAIIADTNSNYAGTASASASVDITMTSGLTGEVAVGISPSGYPGTVSLTGAEFADGSTSKTASNGDVLAIVGTPLDSDIDKYSITAALTATVPGATSTTVRLWTTSSPAYAQRDISTGQPSTQVVTAFDEVDDPDLMFSPELTTAVQAQFVELGAPYIDTVTALVADDSESWRQLTDGSYIPIVAHGTLYGPFEDAPVESATVPVGAPVLGSMDMTLSGPGTYTTPGTILATAPGFATWVWEISAADQPLIFRDRIPDDYYFSDRFGRAAETHVVGSSLEATTLVGAANVAPGEGLWDTLTASAPTYPWLTIGGVEVPVTFTGTAYWEPGNVAPAAGGGPSAAATILGTRTLVATGPGTYSTEADPIAAPLENGFVVWQWRLADADQPTIYQGYFDEWTDTYGLSAETTRVQVPAVVTEAQAEVALTDEARDVAIVDGLVPVGAYLTFAAYHQPVEGDPVVDAAGDPVTDVATGEPLYYTAAEVAVPLCSPGTQVFDSSPDPVVLTAGANAEVRYDSPSFTPVRVGTVFWVEQLWSAGDVLLSEGTCGAVGETTEVVLPRVRTVALSVAAPGALAHDVAFVDGPVPTGATLVFAAYVHSEDVDMAAGERGVLLCETASSPVPVTSGVLVDERFQSPDCEMPTSTASVYWVESLLDRAGNVLAEGVYGAATEITIVAPLPHMGLSSSWMIAGSGGVVAFILGAGLLVYRRSQLE